MDILCREQLFDSWNTEQQMDDGWREHLTLKELDCMSGLDGV